MDWLDLEAQFARVLGHQVKVWEIPVGRAWVQWDAYGELYRYDMPVALAVLSTFVDGEAGS